MLLLLTLVLSLLLFLMAKAVKQDKREGCCGSKSGCCKENKIIDGQEKLTKKEENHLRERFQS